MTAPEALKAFQQAGWTRATLSVCRVKDRAWRDCVTTVIVPRADEEAVALVLWLDGPDTAHLTVEMTDHTLRFGTAVFTCPADEIVRVVAARLHAIGGAA